MSLTRPRTRPPATRRVGYLALVTAGFLLFAPNGQAQRSSLRVSVPSPTAASLGKFGDVPMSLYTGRPEITIPLFTVKGRTLELPIGLRYAGGGIRVEEIGGWAGIGWALEAGGVITRSVRGIPDDDNDGFLYTGNRFYVGSNWYAPPQSFVEDLRDGFQDPQPDQYFFSFAGRSGQFMYGPDSTSMVVRTIPYQKLRIEPVIAAGGPITAFVITGEDGTRYTFGAAETTTDMTVNAPLPPGKRNQTYNSSWHLTEIRSVGGDVIALQYSTYVATHRQGIQEQRYDLTSGECSPRDVEAINEHRVTAQRLTSISAAAHTISFIPGSRTDALSPSGGLQEPRLDLITVATPSGVVLRQFKLEHDYSTGRLTLRNVYELGASGDSLPPHSFTYSGALPPTSSKAQDHWGYWNGQSSNQTLIPRTAISGVILPGAERAPDATFAAAGILTKVTYPTGGWNEFLWEGNDYHGQSTSQLLVQHSVGPGIDDVTTFTVPGEHPMAVEVIHARGPDGCEELYFSCPYSTLTGPGINWTFYQNGSASQSLPPGQYTLRTRRGNLGDPPPDAWATATVQWYETVTETGKSPGGGLRVKELQTGDGVGNLTIKKYKYRLWSDTTISSGNIQFLPVYAYRFNQDGCSYVNRTSMSRMPLGDGGPLVDYREVTVWHGATGEFGKTVHRFRSVADAGDQGVGGADWYPFFRPTSYAWKRGQQIESSEYSGTAQPQQRLASTHAFRTDTATTRTLRGVTINFFQDINPWDGPNYVFTNFSVISAWTHKESDTTVVFDTTGTSSFSSVRTYAHGNPAHLQLSEMTETNSDGTQRITRMKYPADYGIASIGEEGLALNAMQGSAHIHDAVIERWVAKRVGATESVMEAELTTYKQYGPGQYLPHKRFVLNNPTPLP